MLLIIYSQLSFAYLLTYLLTYLPTYLFIESMPSWSKSIAPELHSVCMLSCAWLQRLEYTINTRLKRTFFSIAC